MTNYKDFGNMFSKMGNSLRHFSVDQIGNAVMDIAGSAGKVYNSVVNPYDREDTAYERSLQQTIFEREDNATQRKVADLEKAGLSPILATGAGANAGQAISARHEGDANPLEAVNFVMNMKQNMANLAHTKADQERIDLQNKIDAYNLGKAKDLGITTGAANSEFAALANAITAFADKMFGVHGTPGGEAGEVALVDALADSVNHIGGRPTGEQQSSKMASYFYNGGKTTNDDGSLFSPNDMMADFNDYNSYVHACKLAGVNAVDWDTWTNVKFHNGNKSSSKHNGAGGRW